eukprot:Sspe_Gene.99587::Locus_73262_Transcript_1_1_Confidence_1.000_Length_1769::g.99587::m.99587
MEWWCVCHKVVIIEVGLPSATPPLRGADAIGQSILHATGLRSQMIECPLSQLVDLSASRSPKGTVHSFCAVVTVRVYEHNERARKALVQALRNLEAVSDQTTRVLLPSEKLLRVWRSSMEKTKEGPALPTPRTAQPAVQAPGGDEGEPQMAVSVPVGSRPIRGKRPAEKQMEELESFVSGLGFRNWCVEVGINGVNVEAVAQSILHALPPFSDPPAVSDTPSINQSQPYRRQNLLSLQELAKRGTQPREYNFGKKFHSPRQPKHPKPPSPPVGLYKEPVFKRVTPTTTRHAFLERAKERCVKESDAVQPVVVTQGERVEPPRSRGVVVKKTDDDRGVYYPPYDVPFVNRKDNPALPRYLPLDHVDPPPPEVSRLLNLDSSRYSGLMQQTGGAQPFAGFGALERVILESGDHYRTALHQEPPALASLVKYSYTGAIDHTARSPQCCANRAHTVQRQEEAQWTTFPGLGPRSGSDIASSGMLKDEVVDFLKSTHERKGIDWLPVTVGYTDQVRGLRDKEFFMGALIDYHVKHEHTHRARLLVPLSVVPAVPDLGPFSEGAHPPPTDPPATIGMLCDQ